MPEGFRARLEEAVGRRHSRAHPFTERWGRGELTRAQLGRWAVQQWHDIGLFSQYLAGLYARCPEQDARDFFLENMWEEELAGTRHAEYRLRFAEACGVDRAAVPTTPTPPTTEALVDRCRTRSLHDPWVVGAAGLNIGRESQVVGIMERVTPPLRARYGFRTEEIGYFEAHLATDHMHAERAYAIVDKHAQTPDLQAACLARVARATEMRWLFTDGIQRACEAA